MLNIEIWSVRENKVDCKGDNDRVIGGVIEVVIEVRKIE